MSSSIATQSRTFALAGALAALLAGCGGSGDDTFCGYDAFGDPIFCGMPSPPVPVASTDTFPVVQSLVNIATQTYSYNISAYDAYGDQFTIVYSSAPGAAGMFNGNAASTANVTQAFYENGTLVQTQTYINYYDLSPYQFLGASGSLPGSVAVVNSFSSLPTTGTVGQTFPELSATLYHDTTQTVSDGTLTETLSLMADTASTALLCLDDTVALTQTGLADNLVNGSTANCFRIDTGGNVQGMQISTTVNGGSMLFF